MIDGSARAPRIEFVVSCGPEVGLGHAVRSAALSEALRQLGAHTVVSPVDNGLPPWISASFDAVTPGGRIAGKPGVDCVVFDLPLDLTEEHLVGPLVVLIDDGPPRDLLTDIVVNPNLMATASGYRVRDGGRVMAGARFALLSPRVIEARSRYPCPDGDVRRILITCGAADPTQVTEFAIRALSPLAATVEVAALVGPLNPRTLAIEHVAAEAGARVVTDSAVASEVISSQIAVTTLGVTASELACIGVPNIALAHSPIQVPHLLAYAESRLIHAVGMVDDLEEDDLARAAYQLIHSASDRGDLYARSRGLVDGRGAARVARGLLDRIDR